MSFEDLPPDWPSLPLSDPRLARDVLDLCISHADRRQGGLSVLMLRSNLCLAQPVFVADPMPRQGRGSALSNLFQGCVTAAQGGAVIVAVARPHGGLTDADRELHQDVIDACAAVGVRLLSCHLITADSITELPGLDEAA